MMVMLLRRKKNVKKTKKQNVESDRVEWKDTDKTTRMWQIVSQNRALELSDWLEDYPEVAFDSIEGRSWSSMVGIRVATKTSYRFF